MDIPSNIGGIPLTGRAIDGSNPLKVKYPDPFLDISSTNVPVSIGSLFKRCRYYFYTHPIINAACMKMAAYPITDLIYKHGRKEIVDHYKKYDEEYLRLREFLILQGIDYYVYGNFFVSVIFPFIKYIKCSKCKKEFELSKIKEKVRIINYSFHLNCPSCKNYGEGKARDIYIRSARKIKLKRWNPELIAVEEDFLGNAEIRLSIPSNVAAAISTGKIEKLVGIPQQVIDALKEGKVLIISPRVFHGKRPNVSDSSEFGNYGCPLPFPVLKDIFLAQIMRKTQESLMLEHAIPLRLLFPQATSGDVSPFSTIPQAQMRDYIEGELYRWKIDPNYIPYVPIPVQQLSMGGDARALMMHPELDSVYKLIAAGIGVPLEFIYGGLSYSGTSVSMRMLENGLIDYRKQQILSANSYLNKIASYMDWPKIAVEMTRFRMADDVQYKGILMNLRSMGEISSRTLLDEFDVDITKELDIMKDELKYYNTLAKEKQMASIELQLELAKKQQKLQERMQAEAQESQTEMESQTGPTQKVNILNLGQALAKKLTQAKPEEAQQYLENLAKQNPRFAELVSQYYAQLTQPEAETEATPEEKEKPPEIETRPLPEQKPPRRENKVI